MPRFYRALRTVLVDLRGVIAVKAFKVRYAVRNSLEIYLKNSLQEPLRTHPKLPK